MYMAGVSSFVASTSFLIKGSESRLQGYTLVYMWKEVGKDECVCTYRDTLRNIYGMRVRISVAFVPRSAPPLNSKPRPSWNADFAPLVHISWWFARVATVILWRSDLYIEVLTWVVMVPHERVGSEGETSFSKDSVDCSVWTMCGRCALNGSSPLQFMSLQN